MLGEWLELGLLALAGFVSGCVNAVAGGGSLLVFPALLGTGLPPLAANVTNAVAQFPGFVGAVFSQRGDLRANGRRLVPISVAALLGSLGGCALLLSLPGAVFDAVVPALVGLSAVLMAFQHRIRRWIGNPDQHGPDRSVLLTAGIFLASVYGGYFGGARSIILVVILVLTANAALSTLNAAKNLLGLLGSLVTVVVYALLAPVDWAAVAALVPTTLLGGMLGGRLARRLPAAALRWTVVVIAAAVALYMALD
ncbi:sulfite exporter TauE/SafE family protein [Actinopolyspora mortivallis]|uniref:Probable membrane transporter protein n=1 Tax=Actinopolyspora mortivallis TaxID=33906 RepID=A0A2T0GUV7_ACTMO|nr:sulfite exporter TauE/SafE family protein [Actinopolyspora mortivallis]PRW62892.1 sulfite exporter TauE/SafE family protein [Actinopolyspora mortivallis]